MRKILRMRGSRPPRKLSYLRKSNWISRVSFSLDAGKKGGTERAAIEKALKMAREKNARKCDGPS